MMSIADEIQAISENAEKCINYPIGDKLAAFIKQQDESNKTNFVLSGVLIYASAKIFGRKVDYLEQEIHGIAKNFAAVEKQTSNENRPEKEIKKTRTKKFKIQDGVSLDKVSFEEKPIQVLQLADINKTLAVPSRINRLQRMKEFFSKNKSRTGKLVIPKNLLFTNDHVLSNFGSTQIHDYDDNKDIVGSRRDFTSFSYFINNATGELQSDVSPANHAERSTYGGEDFHQIKSCERLYDQNLPPTPPPECNDWDTLRNTPPSADVALETMPEKPFSPISINIDDGIELDEAEFNLLKPMQPTIKLTDMRVTSPNLFPPDVQVNDSVDVAQFIATMESIQEAGTPLVKTRYEPENQMKNIFMIPLKRLKHRCLFDLPYDEYGELKRKKREQHKSLEVDQQCRVTRIFKPPRGFDSDSQPFKGFSKAQQSEPMTFVNYRPMEKLTTHRENLSTQLASTAISDRKYSNDSGVEIDMSSEEINRTGDETDFDQSGSSDGQGNTDETLNTSKNNESDNINMSGGDSCYHSLESGGSSNIELSSFFKDIESRNNTINESEFTDASHNESSEESEERVAQMQQSAINIAKWKEYLKPILAGSEARSKIDMQECGIEMINKIGNVNDSATLAAITEPGKTPAYFLTMLQLINNRNVEIAFGERSMRQPVDMKNIKITLMSRLLHRDKFDQMGQQFIQQEEKKTCLKRKAVQTSTPAKRAFIKPGSASLSFNSPNVSQSMIEDMEQDDIVLSQGSSGYFSQSSIFSDC